MKYSNRSEHYLVNFERHIVLIVAVAKALLLDLARNPDRISHAMNIFFLQFMKGLPVVFHFSFITLLLAAEQSTANTELKTPEPETTE